MELAFGSTFGRVGGSFPGMSSSKLVLVPILDFGMIYGVVRFS